MKNLPNIQYAGNESALQNLRFGQLVPVAEKTKEFWLYEGSETTEPFRECVKWIVFRSAIPISSDQASLQTATSRCLFVFCVANFEQQQKTARFQLEKLRELKRSRYEDEHEQRMTPIRPLQALNGRIIRTSLKSVAQVDLA